MNSLNQTASQFFSMPRYTALLKAYLAANGRALMLYTIALIGLSVLVGACLGYNLGTRNQFVGDTGASLVFMASYIATAISVCFAVSASLMFTSLQTRASRIATFMFPASLFEKYIVRLTVYLVLFAICFVFAMLCGECTRMLTSAGDNGSIFTEYMNVLTGSFVAYYIGTTLAGHAIFTLGSSLWPRRSFFKTAVAWMAIAIVIAIFTPISMVRYMTEAMVRENWLYIIGTYVFAIAVYYLAWLRFSRTQIVQRFMMD